MTRKDIAIRQAAACAREKFAGEDARISKGELIARNDGAILHTDTFAQVRSDRDPEIFYEVRDQHCDCPDWPQAPGGRCKHVWAVYFCRIAHTALTLHGEEGWASGLHTVERV